LCVALSASGQDQERGNRQRRQRHHSALEDRGVAAGGGGLAIQRSPGGPARTSAHRQAPRETPTPPLAPAVACLVT
jgi:hypothetical protein